MNNPRNPEIERIHGQIQSAALHHSTFLKPSAWQAEVVDDVGGAAGTVEQWQGGSSKPVNIILLGIVGIVVGNQDTRRMSWAAQVWSPSA